MNHPQGSLWAPGWLFVLMLYFHLLLFVCLFKKNGHKLYVLTGGQLFCRFSLNLNFLDFFLMIRFRSCVFIRNTTEMRCPQYIPSGGTRVGLTHY